MPPYAVRVRTATGWQDIALQGAPGKSVAIFEQPNDPASAAIVGDMWIDTDAVAVVSETIRTVRTGQSYVVGGPLAAGMTIPSFFVPIMGVGQTTKIIGHISKTTTGGIIVQLTRNGSNIGGTVLVGSAKFAYTYPSSFTIADGDEIGVVLSGGSGSPANLSLTVVFEHTV